MGGNMETNFPFCYKFQGDCRPKTWILGKESRPNPHCDPKTSIRVESSEVKSRVKTICYQVHDIDISLYSYVCARQVYSLLKVIVCPTLPSSCKTCKLFLERQKHSKCTKTILVQKYVYN